MKKLKKRAYDGGVSIEEELDINISMPLHDANECMKRWLFIISENMDIASLFFLYFKKLNK